MNIFKRKQRLPAKHWSDITVGQHKAILDLYNREDDDLLLLYGLIEIVYGINIDSMTLNEANKYANTLSFINEKPKARRARKEYILNGRKYSVCLNPQELSTSQYIDFQQVAPKASEMPAEFLSILMIPKGCHYNEGYSIEDVVKDINDYMLIEDCLGLSAFFFTLFRISIKRSIKKVRRMTARAIKEGLMTKEQCEALTNAMEALEYASGLKQ